MTTSAPEGPLVVGYDGRTESEVALDRAFEESALRNVGVVVLVVAGIPYGPMDPYQPATLDIGYIPPIPPEGPVEIQGILNEAKRRLKAAGIDGTVEWSLGDPASEILRVAQEHDASAIVVGTHHHSALGRFFGNDVAADVARDAQCEVLVAH